MNQLPSLANQISGEASAAPLEDLKHPAHDRSLHGVATQAPPDSPGASAAIPGSRGVATHHAASNSIPADGILRFAFGDEEIAFLDRPVGTDECEPLHIDLDGAFGLVAVPRKANLLVRADLDSLVFEKQCDRLLEDLGVVDGDLHLAFDVAGCRGTVVVVAEMRENAPGESRRHG